MQLTDQVVLVTGGASGLGLATARRAIGAGARVVIADLPSSTGSEVANELGDAARFVAADVTDGGQVTAAVDSAKEWGTLRAAVHTAGRGGALRLVDRAGAPGDAQLFAEIVRTNLVGTFTVCAITAAAMVGNEPSDGDRGAIVLTASAAAFEGQIGQSAYAASKAGVVGLTLCAARDLAARAIRVNTIAPGVMDTPMLARMRDDIRSALEATVPHPPRLGTADEYASMAWELLVNGYVNGETIRLDGAIRMAPR